MSKAIKTITKKDLKKTIDFKNYKLAMIGSPLYFVMIDKPGEKGAFLKEAMPSGPAKTIHEIRASTCRQAIEILDDFKLLEHNRNEKLTANQVRERLLVQGVRITQTRFDMTDDIVQIVLTYARRAGFRDPTKESLAKAQKFIASLLHNGLSDNKKGPYPWP